MSRPALDYLAFLLRLRGPRTAMLPVEQQLCADLARGLERVAEVGVYEGSTSTVLVGAISESGQLWLVDPYEPGSRVERLLGTSFPLRVAEKTLRSRTKRVVFVRLASLDAAVDPRLADLEMVLIDADHSYEAVRRDFLAWSRRLAPHGLVLLHDSRTCSARPELDDSVGPVRLAREIESGSLGAWRLVGSAASLSAFQKADE